MDVSAGESKLRVELAAAYRLTHQLGWDFIVWNHITARVPGAERHFLINPFGLSYEEVCASNLVKIDLQGNVIGSSKYGVNQPGFIIHGAIHEAREDLHCVMHTHTAAGAAVSSVEDGLVTLTQDALLFHGRVAYHDFEGIVADTAERRRLLADLGDKPAMVLRNHGLLTAGPTVAAAFTMMFFLQRACEIQVATLSMGRPLVKPAAEICRLTASQYYADSQQFENYGKIEFAAMMRRLDRIDPSYRH